MSRHKNILNNQSGMALMFVLSIIGIFTLIMYSFKFDVKLSLIKAENSTDKHQARLNAESGLHLALIRLEIYSNILNYLQKNKKVQQYIENSMVNQVWSLPLKLPLEITENTNLIDKASIQKFQENFLMEGEVLISISSLGNKININSIRKSQYTDFLEKFEQRTSQSTTTTLPQAGGSQDDDSTSPQEELEKRFKTLLENAFLAKEESDEFFANKYSGTNIDELIAALKYYMSDKNVDIGPLTNQMASEFQKLEITPKHAPMSNISEMYLLPYWDDTLIDLIKNEITVHGKMVIDLNRITGNLLKLLVPDISDEDIKLFFEYKNDPTLQIEFESINDLGNYFIDEVRIVSKEDFDTRVELLEQSGITFGARPELFQVTVNGIYQNASYNLNAIVTIPRAEIEPKTTSNTPGIPVPSTTTTTTQVKLLFKTSNILSQKS